MLIFIKKLDRRLNSNKSYKITYALFFCETCECYVEKPISHKGLMSCGCTNKFKSKGQPVKHGDSLKGKRKRLYNIWSHIKDRCLNQNNDAFHNYGGREITICDEWENSYEEFRDWALNNGYNGSLEIDRIENDGNYEPSNCHWITRKENKLKQRRIKLTLKVAEEIRVKRKNGVSCKQLSEEYFIGLRQIYYILHNKQWISLNDNYEIIKVKRFNKKQINEIRDLYKAKIYTQKEISEIYGLSQGYISEIVTNKKGLV